MIRSSANGVIVVAVVVSFRGPLTHTHSQPRTVHTEYLRQVRDQQQCVSRWIIPEHTHKHSHNRARCLRFINIFQQWPWKLKCRTRIGTDFTYEVLSENINTIKYLMEQKAVCVLVFFYKYIHHMRTPYLLYSIAYSYTTHGVRKTRLNGN